MGAGGAHLSLGWCPWLTPHSLLLGSALLSQLRCACTVSPFSFCSGTRLDPNIHTTPSLTPRPPYAPSPLPVESLL